jgi:hypothetical protein
MALGWCAPKWAPRFLPVDVVAVVGAQTDIRRDPESAAAEAASAQVISSMRDSAQVTSSGAINSMIAAMSTRPNRQNRSTCSRISVPIALTPPPPCEPVHIRCARLCEINSRWTIDGTNRKNLGRYVNHSCRPNAEAHNIGHKVVIRAIKNIRTGAEITYNYGRDYLSNVITRRGCKCDKCRKKRADARAKARAKSRQAHDPDA